MSRLVDLGSIRNAIAGLIHSATLLPVVPADDDGDMPAYPYVTHGQTGAYRTPFRHDIEEYDGTGDELMVTESKTGEFTLSLTVYDDGEDEAARLCMKIRDWLDRPGRLDLDDLGVTLVNIGDVDNRTLMIGDHREYRWGVDAILQVLDRTVRVVGHIETYTIKQEVPYEG